MSLSQYMSLQGLPDLLDALPAGLLSRARLNLAGLCETNADVHHLYEDPRALQALLLLPYSLYGFCLILPCCNGRVLTLSSQLGGTSLAAIRTQLMRYLVSALFAVLVKPGSRSKPKMARRQIHRNSYQICYVLECLMQLSRNSTCLIRRMLLVHCCVQLSCRHTREALRALRFLLYTVATCVTLTPKLPDNRLTEAIKSMMHLEACL